MEMNDAAPFSFEELFYSKTDRRGIIQTGNSVFQRVSGYSWHELIDKPHSLIRHPDMPRGVFHLIWDHLKSERPIGAFVKNKSKDGKYYWVFALAMPTSDGFISVRMKPGGKLFERIEKEYRDLRELENNQKISPTESQGRLLSKLHELGFPSYSIFMAAALSNQIENRCFEMNIGVSRKIESMKLLQTSSAEVMKSTKSILGSFEKTELIPLNLEVLSARLGPKGQQLLVVANQYQKNGH